MRTSPSLRHVPERPSPQTGCIGMHFVPQALLPRFRIPDRCRIPQAAARTEAV